MQNSLPSEKCLQNWNSDILGHKIYVTSGSLLWEFLNTFSQAEKKCAQRKIWIFRGKLKASEIINISHIYAIGYYMTKRETKYWYMLQMDESQNNCTEWKKTKNMIHF